jgi:plastocyanin
MLLRQRTLFLKLVSIAVLLLIVFSSLAMPRLIARAAPASYTVLAGASLDEGNGPVVDALAFFPATLKVHRGDSVVWQFVPIHTVHFALKGPDLLVPQDIDGKQVPIINPFITSPNAKDGDSLKDNLESGLLGDPSGPTTFTLVIDSAPGTYTYICDLHTGMIGTIVVAEDTTAVPSPAEAAKQGKAEVDAVMASAQLTYVKSNDSAVALGKKGADTLQVSAGLTAGTGSINRYFPSVGVVQEGQSVNWTVPSGLEPHTVTFPLPEDGNIPPSLLPITDKKNNVYLTAGPTLLPTGKSGDPFVGDPLGSGLLLPGQSFAVKFPKAGIYKYFCAIHPGQIGTIIVLPTASK